MKNMMITIIVVILVLSGCIKAEIIKETSVPANRDAINELLDSVESESGLVVVTLPADYVGTVDPLSSMTKEPRIKEMIVNDDGSVTYLIRRELHVEVFEYFTEQFQLLSEELAENVSNGSIIVEHTADFKEIVITVDGDVSYEDLDNVITKLGDKAIIYQTYIGFEAYVEVNAIDEGQGDIIESRLF